MNDYGFPAPSAGDTIKLADNSLVGQQPSQSADEATQAIEVGVPSPAVAMDLGYHEPRQSPYQELDNARSQGFTLSHKFEGRSLSLPSQEIWLSILGGLALFGAIWLGGGNDWVDTQRFWDNLAVWFEPSSQLEIQQSPAKPEAVPAMEQEPAHTPVVEEAQPQLFADLPPEIQQNPYWYIPVTPVAVELKLGKALGERKQNALRAQLQHHYVYQGYKAVITLMEKRYQGAEVLFYEALGHPKFWTRMLALEALASYGYELNTDTVESVLQGARPGLQRRYIKRYGDHLSSARLYVLEQMIKLSSARVRVAVLELLYQHRVLHWHLYHVASFYDNAAEISAWRRKRGLGQEMPPSAQQRFSSAVMEVYSELSKRQGPEGQVIEVQDTDSTPHVKNVQFYIEESQEASEAEEAFGEPAVEADHDGFESLREAQ